MMSSLTFVIMLLIMIIIPTILYTFFFLINCPPNPFELLRRRGSTHVENTLPRRNSKMVDIQEDESTSNKNKTNIELIFDSSLNLGKDAECPVCLSVYVEGEELKQLNYCKHMFHKSCIDKWLSSHCNCPVCRAFIGNQFKFVKDRESRVLPSRDYFSRHDLLQGLPDSAGLV